jgi:uncharacterized membrane protein
MLTISIIILFIYITLPTTLSSLSLLIRKLKKKPVQNKKADVIYTYVDRTRKLQRRK